MKIQTFKITIAVPDGTEFVKPDKITSVIRDYPGLFDARIFAVEVKEIEKYIEVEK